MCSSWRKGFLLVEDTYPESTRAADCPTSGHRHWADFLVDTSYLVGAAPGVQGVIAIQALYHVSFFFNSSARNAG